MNHIKQLQEEYQEEFHKPKKSVALLTQEEAIFLRAVMTLNYFNEDKQNVDTSRTRKRN